MKKQLSALGIASEHLRTSLKREGYVAVSLLENKCLDQELLKTALDIAKGKYTDICIYPASALLYDQGEARRQVHVVYARLNKRHPEIKKLHSQPHVSATYIPLVNGSHFQF